MRLKGTKYKKVDKLPKDALTVREFAEVNEMGSAAYVQVKYDRYNDGYKTPTGKFLNAPHPGYDIVCFQGINFVTKLIKPL